MKCLLCESPQPAPFKVLRKPERSYYHCADCDLIFMAPAERMTSQDEKARYDLHQNEDQAGYRAFLAPLIKEVDLFAEKAQRLPRDISALDFGCGPTAFLGSTLVGKGYHVTNYDLFYFPDQDALRKTYHVITSTEVWEHFHDPRVEIERQLRLLKTGGILAVMTSAHKGEAHFHDWHYRRDLTHVTFFSEKTMTWLAEHFKLQVLKAKSPYWIFQKWSE